MEGHPRAKSLVPGDLSLHMPNSAASTKAYLELITLSAAERHYDLHVRRYRRSRIRLDVRPFPPHVFCCAHSFPPWPSRRFPLEPRLSLQMEPRAVPPLALTPDFICFRTFCSHRFLGLPFMRFCPQRMPGSSRQQENEWPAADLPWERGIEGAASMESTAGHALSRLSRRNPSHGNDQLQRRRGCRNRMGRYFDRLEFSLDSEGRYQI